MRDDTRTEVEVEAVFVTGCSWARKNTPAYDESVVWEQAARSVAKLMSRRLFFCVVCSDRGVVHAELWGPAEVAAAGTRKTGDISMDHEAE